MHYVTVFDAAADPLRHWSFFATGLVLMAAGAVVALVPQFQRYRGLRGTGQTWFGILFFGFSLLWTLGAGFTVIAENLRARDDVRSGRCTVVEGTVEDFHPMPEEGHEMESFTVRGVRFEYSDFVITAGFNNTASHGGPIQAGLPVRICYKDGLILRLEIAQPST